MGQVATIGLDIAKSTFQVHGVDASGEVILRRRLTRARVVPFREAGTLLGWNSGLRHFTSLGARVAEARPRCPADATELRQGVCEASEERHGRCRSDLRGGDQADD